MAQTWFEGIQALLPLSPLPEPPVPAINGGFESPVFGANTHTVDPNETGWKFTVSLGGAGSGIDCGNPFNSASGSGAYEGAQQAFLQGSGNSTTTRLWRVFSNFTVGEYYRVSFAAKCINGYQGVNPFQMRLLDGAMVMPLFGGNNIVPATNNYTAYLSEPFRATGPNMTLEFSDHALSTSQNVSWIDAVGILPIPSVSVAGSMNENQFKLQFAGFTNHNYSVIGTTNLTLPLADWSSLGSAQ